MEGSMKNTYKKCTIIAVILVMLLTMVSCGDGDKTSYVGTWKATIATMDGAEINVSDVIGEYTMDIKDNGEIHMTVGDKEGTATWEESENGLVVIDGDQKTEFVAEEDKLKLESEGIAIYFEK
jgi:hypothetical protein